MPAAFRFAKLLLGAAFSLLNASCIKGEPSELFPISVEGRWGYIDAQGKVVIEPKFLQANKFSEGLAVVAVAGTSKQDRELERKYQGFIGPDGEFVIPPEPPPEARAIENFSMYSYRDFHDGMARIHVNDASGMDGYIDRTGKVVVPLKFDPFSSDFSEGLAFVRTWRHWKDPGPKKTGFIDKRGQFVIENDAIQFASKFAEGYAFVTLKNDKGEHGGPGLIDKKGNFVIAPGGEYRPYSPPINGAIIAGKDKKIGLISVRGEVIVPFGEFDEIIRPIDGNIFTAKVNGKTVLIDATGKRLAEVTEPGDVDQFSNGMATIEQEGRIGFIDATGAVRIAPQFDRAQSFDRGLALVEIGETSGYINLQGEFVWKTDRWDEPLRNSIREPLSTFLPETTAKALPLSYNWEGVKNGIVFVADGDLEAMQAWFKKRCSNTPDVKDSRIHLAFGKLDVTIYRPNARDIEMYAIANSYVEDFFDDEDEEEDEEEIVDNREDVDSFIDFYTCDNMRQLRKQFPNKIIGILIEN